VFDTFGVRAAETVRVLGSSVVNTTEDAVEGAVEGV